MSTSWQHELREAIHDSAHLLKLLELPASLLTQTITTKQRFMLRVPKGYVARMRKGDPNDPLLRQVLPLLKEHKQLQGFSLDPVGDTAAEKVPCLLHKYQGRVLWITTGTCAIHCRYCFRQHFPYTDANPATDHWQPSLKYIEQHPDITELILSGGDPLTLTNARLQALTNQLENIDHLHTLRIHSRLPVVLPERIDEGLLAWLTTQHLRVVMVIHCNHPNEIDTDVSAAMKKLSSAGVILLNQSVLLKNINDNAATLAKLSERLFSAGVLPYYLHQLDKVQGSAHFEVDTATARKLVAEVSATLPGYLVPRLVQEIPGMSGKTPL